MKVMLSFGEGLTHVLGLETNTVVLEFTKDLYASQLFMSHVLKYLIDNSNSLNYMFVDCKQVQPLQMGDFYWQNLLVCPLDVDINVKNDLHNVSYIPTNHKQKLNPGIIDIIHVTVNNINSEKLYCG